MSNVKLRCPNCGEVQGLEDITFSEEFIFELQCVFCSSWIILMMFVGDTSRTQRFEISPTEISPTKEVENDND
jgi:hypothetical protein